MVNKAILIGNTGSDVEVVNFDNGSIAKVSLATSENWKDKQTGEKKSKTEWHSLVFNGNLVKIVESYVKKGDKIYVEGSISYRQYENNGEKKYFTEIKVNQLKMLGSKTDSSVPQEPEGTGAYPNDDLGF